MMRFAFICLILLALLPAKCERSAKKAAARDATVQADLTAALDQYFATLDPQSEITRRYGPYVGLGAVTYSPGGPFDVPPTLSTTVKFANAEAMLTLRIRKEPQTKILGITLHPAEEYLKGQQVELRGKEYWALLPGGAESRLALDGGATHPQAQ